MVGSQLLSIIPRPLPQLKSDVTGGSGLEMILHTPQSEIIMCEGWTVQR